MLNKNYSVQSVSISLQYSHLLSSPWLALQLRKTKYNWLQASD